MRKTKTQKGITLVALIITIVVLLILAVVAITAIQDEDLIEKVNGAATKYNESVGNEVNQLGNYADVLSGYLPQPEPEKEMITITVNDKSYTLEKGMTWRQFIAKTEYSKGDFSIANWEPVNEDVVWSNGLVVWEIDDFIRDCRVSKTR